MSEIDVTRWLAYSRAYMRRRMRDRDAADSAAGAALAAAIRHYDGSTPWQAYLLGGLKLAARTAAKMRGRQPQFEPMPHGGPWYDFKHHAVDARLDWESLTTGLPEQTRRVMLAWGVGFSFVEIGKSLSISKSRAHQAFWAGIEYVQRRYGRQACL